MAWVINSVTPCAWAVRFAYGSVVPLLPRILEYDAKIGKRVKAEIERRILVNQKEQ